MDDQFTFEDVALSTGRTRVYAITGRSWARVQVTQEQMGGWYPARLEWSGARTATPEAAEQIASALAHAAKCAREWDKEKGLD